MVSGLLIGLVLFAALLHAIWNAIAKAIPDRLVASALIGVVYLVCGALGALVLAGGLPRRGDGLGLAALTGAAIASYTLVDGIGVTDAASPVGPVTNPTPVRPSALL